MPPAQRRKIKKKSAALVRRASKILTVALLFLGFLVYVFFNTRFWNGKDKLSLVIRGENEDVVVSTLDPTVSELTNIIIPANTEVEVSRQLGTWRIKSVWQLGENEGLGGRLLAETVTKHFGFPVAVWADKEAKGFSTGNFSSVVKSLSLPYETNLKIGDRINIALFVLKLKNTKKIDVNLADRYLTKRKLIDGEEGYVLSGSLPQNLLVVFSDYEIANKGSRVAIVDATGKPGVAETVGRVIEVLGAKVASITREEEEAYDCEVQGVDEKMVEKVSMLFSCTKGVSPDLGNFDLEIRLGVEFGRRF